MAMRNDAPFAAWRPFFSVLLFALLAGCLVFAATEVYKCKKSCERQGYPEYNHESGGGRGGNSVPSKCLCIGERTVENRDWRREPIWPRIKD